MDRSRICAWSRVREMWPSTVPRGAALPIQIRSRRYPPNFAALILPFASAITTIPTKPISSNSRRNLFPPKMIKLLTARSALIFFLKSNFGQDARTVRRPWFADERDREQCLHPDAARVERATAEAHGRVRDLRALGHLGIARAGILASPDHSRFLRLPPCSLRS